MLKDRNVCLHISNNEWLIFSSHFYYNNNFILCQRFHFIHPLWTRTLHFFIFFAVTMRLLLFENYKCNVHIALYSPHNLLTIASGTSWYSYNDKTPIERLPPYPAHGDAPSSFVGLSLENIHQRPVYNEKTDIMCNIYYLPHWLKLNVVQHWS